MINRFWYYFDVGYRATILENELDLRAMEYKKPTIHFWIDGFLCVETREMKNLLVLEGRYPGFNWWMG